MSGGFVIILCVYISLGARYEGEGIHGGQPSDL